MSQAEPITFIAYADRSAAQTLGPESVRTRAFTEGYPLFDWLRFMLASVVVLGHSGIIAWEKAPFLAVQVFFALSGWLIGSGLLRTTRSAMPRFFFNRGTRIWIPYFLAIALVYAVSSVRDPIDAVWFRYLATDVTFTHNLYALKPTAEEAIRQMPLSGSGNHFWSISVEEQFYLAAPLLLLLAPWGRAPLLWGGIAAATVLSASWYGAISVGVLAATLHARHADWHRSRLAQGALLVLLVATSVVLVVTDVGTREIAPLFAVAIVLLLARGGTRGGWGELLGGLSYSLYLNAWFVLYVGHSVLKHMGHGVTKLDAFGLYLIALGAASLHYLFLERPVLRRRGQYYSRLAGLRFRTVAYLLFTVGVALGALTWGWPTWN